MSQDMQGVAKIKQSMAIWNYPSKLQWFLILFFSIVLFLSLGLRDHQLAVYKVTIEPAKNSNGPVKVVLYGNRYEDYLTSGALHVPTSGWHIEKFSDYTTITAVEHAPPLIIYSEDESVVIGLLHYTGAGVARLVDGNNSTKLIPLQANSESVSALSIGGRTSDVQMSGYKTKHISIFILVMVFALILLIFTLIALTQLKNNENIFAPKIVVCWREVLFFALPLLVTTSIVLLSHWPGSVAFDGSLQWFEAVNRGHLNYALGIPTTLFMRLFTYLSMSPAWVIVFQCVLSALGVALVLKELRYRGVPLWVAQSCAILIAITPQYPTFFTNLGKDALSASGLIFLFWSLLFVVRNIKADRLNHLVLFILIISAVFSGVMRINAIPSVVLVVLVTMAYIYYKGHRKPALFFGAVFLLAVIFVPKIAYFLSDEQQSAKVSVTNYKQMNSINTELPLGSFANLYIYQLFSAAVHLGVPLKPSDTALFYRIAPRSAWTNYDCFMVDTTRNSVLKEKILTHEEFAIFLAKHQMDLAAAVYRIVRDNPSILIDQQVCITKMLWYVGYNQKPFLALPTIGYDSVKPEFKLIAGENKSLLQDKIRLAIERYFTWAESKKNFWVFWKPALIIYLGMFILSFHLTVRRDTGLLLVFLIPLSLTIVLALVIPFPAYRYQYPSVLLMSLLCTLAFARPNKQSSKLGLE